MKKNPSPGKGKEPAPPPRETPQPPPLPETPPLVQSPQPVPQPERPPRPETPPTPQSTPEQPRETPQPPPLPPLPETPQPPETLQPVQSTPLPETPPTTPQPRETPLPETPPPNTPPVQPPLPETPQPPETLQQYLNSLFQYDHPFNQAYDAADRLQRQYVDLPPAVNPLSGRLLALLVRVMQAKQVLELGTGIGYSAHWLATALEATGGSLITVDSHPRTGQEAEHHFDKSGLRSRISFYHSDATEAVAALKRRLSEGTLPPFDLIFMDCGKALYRPLLPALISLTRKGGLIAFDDTLIGWEPTVRPSIAAAIADFNEVLRKEPSLYTVNLPIGHGLTLCYKKS